MNGDKTHGEEEQIIRREQWFGSSRGLERLRRPDLMRSRAVEQARQLRLQEGSDGHRWQALGPESMTMLDWEMGVVSGRVSALAIHPGDENVIYLGGASGGLWRTTDGGASWVPLFDEVGTQTIGSITIDPSSPSTVWVGTGEQGQSCWSYFGMGLYRSTDGGASFTAANGAAGSELEASYVTSVAVHPADSNIVLAGGESWCDGGGWYYGGAFRSTDAGATWAKTFSGAVGDMLFDPVEPDTVYMAVGRWGAEVDGVYRSSDGGLSWVRLENGIAYGTEVGRIRLAMAPAARKVLYALVASSGGARLYQTTDGGDSWSLAHGDACDGQCWYNLCLAVHPARSSEVLVGVIRPYRSTDGGATLDVLTRVWGRNQEVHQDTHVVVYSRADERRFWIAGDGGLWRTDDDGASFVNLNANLNLTQLYDIAVHPMDPGTVFGGAQDNSSSRRAGHQLWDVTAVTGDGFMNVVDPADTAVVFQTSYPSEGYPRLLKSTDGGGPESFRSVVPVGLTRNEPYPWVTPLVAVEATAERAGSPLFLASNHVYRSSTAEPWFWFEWDKISDNLTGDDSWSVSVLAPAWHEGLVTLYAGTSNGKLWRADDALAAAPEWVDVTGSYPGDKVTDIAVDPGDVKRVFVTRGSFGESRLYRSLDGGGDWQGVGGGLPDAPANAVAVDPLDSRRVFVGTDVGVFVSVDGGDTVTAMMAGLPLGAVVTDLEITAEPHLLTAGTYGRGAWQLQLEAPVLFADGFESGDASLWASASP